jgi:hypothetical protein
MVPAERVGKVRSGGDGSAPSPEKEGVTPDGWKVGGKETPPWYDDPRRRIDLEVLGGTSEEPCGMAMGW